MQNSQTAVRPFEALLRPSRTAGLLLSLTLSLALVSVSFAAPAPASTGTAPAAKPAVKKPLKKTAPVQPAGAVKPAPRKTLAPTSTPAKSAPVRTAPATTAKPAPATAAAPARPTGKAVETRLDSFSRTVEIQPGKGSWKKAEPKMPLVADDKIRTGVNATARVKMADGSKVLLLPNSQVELEAMSSVEKSIRLLKGKIRAIVTKAKGGSSFKVTTPVGVASVRGTDFEVEVGEVPDQMSVLVFEGQVAVAKLGELGKEVILNPGDRIEFGAMKELGDPIRSGGLPLERMEIRSEMQLTAVKDNILAMAAEESRNADYQVGKSLIDVSGARVRVEEYITRPAANQFKLVVLNERPTRFDYFTYKGTFNTSLPEDLSVALKQVGGRLGAAPDYFLTSYETLMSNTVDRIADSASGGHLVQIGFDGTNYTLTDPTDPGNTRTVEAAVLQGDGSYKIYNPIRDTFSVVSAENRDDALKISVLDATDSYRDLAAGDTYFRTRYNGYTSSINDVVKTAFAKKTTVNNTLAIDLDADFSNAPILAVSEFPSGSGSLHNRLSIYYADGSKTTYDNYIIDDEGKVAPADAFAGVSTSAAYKAELENWNYQQRVTSDEMAGRSIDLVVDPRIGTISGLIQ